MLHCCSLCTWIHSSPAPRATKQIRPKWICSCKGCRKTIPPLWCPPQKRWSCCFHSLSQQMLEGTWCWAATDTNDDRAWRRKRKRFHHLALQSPPSKTSWLSDVHHICHHLEPLRPKKSARRGDGSMTLGEAQKMRMLAVAAGWKNGLVSTGKPASYLLRFGCQCRSNMLVYYAVWACWSLQNERALPLRSRGVFVSVSGRRRRRLWSVESWQGRCPRRWPRQVYGEMLLHKSVT